MKVRLLILASIAVLVIFGISTAWASIGIPSDMPPVFDNPPGNKDDPIILHPHQPPHAQFDPHTALGKWWKDQPPVTPPNGHKIYMRVICSATCVFTYSDGRLDNGGSFLIQFASGETACYSTMAEASLAATNTLQPYLINKCRGKIEEYCPREYYVLENFNARVIEESSWGCYLPE